MESTREYIPTMSSKEVESEIVFFHSCHPFLPARGHLGTPMLVIGWEPNFPLCQYPKDYLMIDDIATKF